jgi:hypothetical protein
VASVGFEAVSIRAEIFLDLVRISEDKALFVDSGLYCTVYVKWSEFKLPIFRLMQALVQESDKISFIAYIFTIDYLRRCGKFENISEL